MNLIRRIVEIDNLPQQMEYARLLEKENRFFCVRCIAAEALLVLGEMRPR